MNPDKPLPVAHGSIYIQARAGNPSTPRTVTLDNGSPAVLAPCGLCAKPMFFAFAEETSNDDGTTTVDLSVAAFHQRYE